MTPSEIGSRPVKGSSYNMISGSSAIVRARATRRDIPPESSEGIRFSTPRKPTAFSFNTTKSRMTASGKSVSSRMGKAMLSKTDKSVNNAPCWNQITPFNQHFTRLRVDLTRNQAHQRGFTATRTTHYGGEIALWNAEVDVVQNRTVAICEGNVFHFDEGCGTHAGERCRKMYFNYGYCKGYWIFGQFSDGLRLGITGKNV